MEETLEHLVEYYGKIFDKKEIPGLNEFNDYFKKFFDSLSRKEKNIFIKFKSNTEYNDINSFFNDFKTKLHNRIEEYNKDKTKGKLILPEASRKGKPIEDKIFRKLVKTFNKKKIPIIIKDGDKQYVNELFYELMNKYIDIFESDRRSGKNVKIETRSNVFITRLENELDTLFNSKLKDKTIIDLQDEIENLKKNLNINKDKMTKDQIFNLSNKIEEVQKQLESIKKEKDPNYKGKIVEESGKTIRYIIGTIVSIITGGGIGGGIGIGIGKSFSKEDKNKYKITEDQLKKIEEGDINNKEVSKIRDRFIEANKEKLDSLTNENVRNNKENLKLLKQSLALGYLPKNIQIQNKYK